MSNLDIAIEYISRGWKVFPLHTPTGKADRPCSCNQWTCEEIGMHPCHKQTCSQFGKHPCHQQACSNIGKHPRTPRGVDDATNDQAQVEQWWTMWPQANIGLATGQALGAIVLDVDPKNGGDETIHALIEKHGKLAEKVYAQTGGAGWHIFFAHPGFRVGNTQSSKDRASYLGAGLDLRGDGGYIVAPGSVHASGAVYEWKQKPNGHWPEIPAWLLEKIQAHQTPAKSAVDFIGDEQLAPSQRHPQLLRWAAQMRHHGLSGDAILSALRIENQTRCNPPKDDEEIIKIAKWIADKPPSDALIAVAEELHEEAVHTGLRRIEDFEQRLDALYEKGFKKGLHPGWQVLADTWTFEEGHTILITGAPTAGKSAFVNAWMNHMAMGYDWRTGYCSPEFHPIEYHALRFIETYQGEPASNLSPRPKMRRDDYEAAKVWVKDHMFFIEPEKGQRRTLRFAMDVARRAQDEDRCNAMVIDPFASLFHDKKGNMRADEWLAEQINTMVEFGRETKITPIVVLHPHMMQKNKEGGFDVVTPYDLNGGAMWYNLFYHILSLHREPQWKNGEINIHVWKCKYQWLGKQGQVTLYHDLATGRYNEFPHRQTQPWYFCNEPEEVAAAVAIDDEDVPDF